MKKIKVLVADDHILVREGVVAMLQNVEDIILVGEASNGEEVLAKIKSSQVDLVIMDIMMPKMNGLEATEIIKKENAEIKVLLLSMEKSSEFLSSAIKSGASGYLPKDSGKLILLEAIKAVYNGGKYFDTKISNLIFEEFCNNALNGHKTVKKAPQEVSKRELEVLKLISGGKSNREVADELFISVRTVDAHRNHIMKKINANSTADLVKYAIKNNLIEL